MTDKPRKPAASVAGQSPRVAQFEVRLTRYLEADGSTTGPLPAIASDSDKLLSLYRWMLLTRSFDSRAIALQRTGQLGTYASNLGQEAIGAALGDVMRAEDVLLPSYREYAAQLQRGARMADILLYWGGDERGMAFQGKGEDFPICVPIATHSTHAVGVAYAFQLRKQPRVAVCALGDGGTSKGDFYEAMNAAGVWQLPLLFVVANNQWAISVPRAAQTGAETIAQKAIAGGFNGEQVDGNDIIALHERISAALERARSGGGPQLIEALTYRLCDHTTADDASRYRSAEELEAQWQREPIVRLYRYLCAQGWWDEARDEALKAECAEQVEVAVKDYLGTEPLPPEAMFEHLYAELPAAYESQREQAAGRGDHG